MDLSDGREAYLAADSWVRQLDASDSPTDEPSVTVRLVSENLKCLKVVLKHVSPPDFEMPVTTRKSLQECYSRLILWVDGYGVEQGELDEAMARSRRLRRAVTEILVSIGRTVLDELASHLCIAEEKIDHGALGAAIQDALFVLDDGYDDSTSDDGESDSGIDGADPLRTTTTDLNEAVKELETDTQCLLDLDPLIKFAVPDPVANKAEHGKPVAVDWAPHSVFSDRVSRRFPKADASLVECLAKANLDRFLRGRAERETRRLAQEVSRIAADAAALLKDSAAANPSESGTKFHDSGLGTSIATPSSYAETVMSYQGTESSASVRIPPLPEGAKNGKSFECNACGRMLVITNNSAWKKHLFLDLRPWLCLELACSSRGIPFSTREDWVQHLAYDHGFAPEWESIDCPLCVHPALKGKAPLLRHLVSHLEEIALGSLPAFLDPETASESGSSSDSESAPSDVSASKASIMKNPLSTSLLTVGVIHELAVREQGFENLLLSLNLKPSREGILQVILNGVGKYDTQVQKWTLKKGSWKALDIFAYNYRRDEDRQQAIENAIKQYDRMKIPPQDSLWQKLLPMEERGKGMCLSKLKAANTDVDPGFELDLEGLDHDSNDGQKLALFDEYFFGGRSRAETPDNTSSVLQPEPGKSDAIPASTSKLTSADQQEHELRRQAGIENGPSPSLAGFATVMPEVQQRQVMEQARARADAEEQRADHKRTVKKWICRDPFLADIPSKAIAVRSLTGCAACSSMKQYGSFYNAVAHLRRMHFTAKDNPNPVRKRDLPPISEIRPWVEEILVSNDQETKVPGSRGQSKMSRNSQRRRTDTRENRDPPVAEPPKTKTVDPVIFRLAEVAGEDEDLRALMRAVASEDASKDELNRFQGVIDRLQAEMSKGKAE